jgi:hypothetical protein
MWRDTLVNKFAVHLIILAALAVNAQAAPPPRHYVSPKDCEYEFDYPGDWVAEPLPDDPNTICRVRLRPRDFAEQMKNLDVDTYTVEVARERGEFLEAAARHNFDFVKGEWVIRGRLGQPSKVDVVVTDQWSGLKGDASVGYYHEGGGYAGLGDWFSLVLEDDQGRVWGMTASAQGEDTFNKILATFRFVTH